jgi:hypothetical protein
LLHELARDHWVVNLHCRDISKRHVEAVFSQVFGYSSLVDPTTYEGLCVCKNDSNAIADKELVRCPIKDPKPATSTRSCREPDAPACATSASASTTAISLS